MAFAEKKVNAVMLSKITTTEELFLTWQNVRPGYRPFSNDGILVEEAWRSASPKIAFLLKESNDNFWDIRGQAWGPSGNSPRFWRNLAIWRYVVTSVLRGDEPSLETAKAVKEVPLADIAYVNLKKKAECRPRSDPSDIQKYVDEDWSFLTRQIEIINPDVLFFCGTFRFVRRKMPTVKLGEGVLRVGNRIAVDFYHPSWWGKGHEEFFSLLKNRLECLKRSANHPLHLTPAAFCLS
jgi:hypothetical protein